MYAVYFFDLVSADCLTCLASAAYDILNNMYV